MAKKKKRKHLYSKKEFFFNLFSLIIVIGIGIYFGYRSIYYYSKQNMAHEGSNQALADVVINNNKLISEGDGFHQDKKGYYFKGKVENNYVRFGNRIFRIVRINTNGTIKLVTDTTVASFMWGDKDQYEKSNLYDWLEKTSTDNSGVYYKTLPNIEKFLVKTKYSIDILKDDKVTKGKKELESYITLLGINDYVTASGKNSYLNNGNIYYLLGQDNDKNNLYVEDDGSVVEVDNTSSYGLKVIITLNKNIISAYGDGTKDNPYTIEQKNDTNYIDSIVKLGNDTWKVYNEEKDVLRLVKLDYIKDNNGEFKYHFSEDEEVFDLEDWNGIAVYLNDTYYNSLSYKDKLIDNDYYIGELSIANGYKYNNIYSEKVRCKVGLLNLFDYDNNDHDDFYLINTLQEDLKYVKYKNGLIGEAEQIEEKHIVPVISIKKDILKKGKGTLDDPYITE